MTILSSHDLARLLLSYADGTVTVLEEVSSGHQTYTKKISVSVETTDCFDDGTVYGTGIKIDKDGDVTLGER